jgi:hypothetical protein
MCREMWSKLAASTGPHLLQVQGPFCCPKGVLMADLRAIVAEHGPEATGPWSAPRCWRCTGQHGAAVAWPCEPLLNVAQVTGIPSGWAIEPAPSRGTPRPQ